ncbi:MAG: type II toxin-antitoxin system RelE/ParE family toxin [Proteobacteria bacterium]|nr:type II toxin-antitoxin system RelE/ParE family toxin [Desulfobacteraceae bacterium]MBU3980021.1 type II toxin-antitoxin system RelE/ParE family toxin [Pseudomonadota bacterium]MBU4013405.1 type II toxin-antitoxin system RelE/ParE family toxin [Pseudomonadota bacterium]MBU4068616.1 type II toxin-antitoxin system RelE/ParE family toxin [Pseudomonadota bacterium]MBU4101009.1 type II toxin-antitoxin system RelE/ParE family toxin [Pseudomonadota bacterium]
MHRTYQLEISPAAKRDLKKIPSPVQNKIVFEHLPKIQDEPYSNSEPLIGALKGERSYHFGRKPEYRIIYYIEDDSITVTIIGTREGIYKRAKRRKK